MKKVFLRCFAIIRSKLIVLAYLILYGYGVPSTARSAEWYLKGLFPEYTTLGALLEHLAGKVVVDIGSGLTHRNPRSLINRVDPTTTFIGVEPKVGFPIGSREGFSRRNILIDVYLKRWFLPLFWRRGHGKVVAAYAQSLPFPDASTDYILSHSAFPWWIRDEKELVDILRECARVLKKGGELRLWPVDNEQLALFANRATVQGEFVARMFTFSHVPQGKLGVLVAPSSSREVSSMILQKRPA